MFIVVGKHLRRSHKDYLSSPYLNCILKKVQFVLEKTEGIKKGRRKVRSILIIQKKVIVQKIILHLPFRLAWSSREHIDISIHMFIIVTRSVLVVVILS